MSRITNSFLLTKGLANWVSFICKASSHKISHPILYLIFRLLYVLLTFVQLNIKNHSSFISEELLTRSSCSNINWQSMLILGISAFINNMYLAQLLKDLLWTKSDHSACVLPWVSMYIILSVHVSWTVNVFSTFFLPFTLFFEKTSKLDDTPNPYVVKTQKFPLSYWQLTFFLWRYNI